MMSGRPPPEEEFESDEGAMSDSRPISALAPTVRTQEESQVEVSASPAFQCLEEVLLIYISILFQTMIKLPQVILAFL